MPRPGQTVTNPVSGETITFVRTAEQTGGTAVELLFEVAPGGAPPAAHVHPHQVETFEVHTGRCRVMVAGEESEAGPGDRVSVPAGVPHLWAAETAVTMTVTLQPALRADEFFEDLCALAQAGRVDAKGMPTPLHFAVLADDHRGLVYLASAPAALQRTVFAVLARLGRALGRGPAGVRAPEVAAAPA